VIGAIRCHARPKITFESTIQLLWLRH